MNWNFSKNVTLNYTRTLLAFWLDLFLPVYNLIYLHYFFRFEKSFTRSYLTGEWDLRLRLYTRGKVDNKYEQDYSAVIEVIDEKGNIDVYDEIVQFFGDKYVHNWIQKLIQR